MARWAQRECSEGTMPAGQRVARSGSERAHHCRGDLPVGSFRPRTGDAMSRQNGFAIISHASVATMTSS
jgi:hypothetical protein